MIQVLTGQSGSRQQELTAQLFSRCWLCRGTFGRGVRRTQKLQPPLPAWPHSRLWLSLQLQKLHHLLWGWASCLFAVQSMRPEDILYSSSFVQDEFRYAGAKVVTLDCMLVVVSIVVMKYHDQKPNWGRKSLFDLYFHNAVHHQKKVRTATQTGPRPGNHGEMPCSTWVTQPAFLYKFRTTSPGIAQPTMGWTLSTISI